MSQGYSGWTNYATWVVNLWWTNDEHEEQICTEQAQVAWDDAVQSTAARSEAARYSLATVLEDRLDMLISDTKLPGLLLDLIGSAVGDVNWNELADSYLNGLGADPSGDGEDYEPLNPEHHDGGGQ